MRIRGAWWLIALALVVAGCGGTGTTTATQTALAVSSVTPASGSTGVAVTAPVAATFSEVMNGATLTSSTFTLTAAGGGAVTGNVSYEAGSSTAVFTPASPLAYNTVYTATIAAGVQTPAGTALGASDSWSFTTASGPAPAVTVFTPGNGSTGVAASTTVTATFSEAMDASTITASTFTLTPQGGAAVGATVSYNAATFTATLTPNAPLAAGTMYTAVVTTGVEGATGSAIANVNSMSFTTAAGPVPTVTAAMPASGATGVDIASTVTATFSEAMDPATIVAGSTFTLTGGGASVTGTVAADPTNTIFTFTPSAPLAYSTTYTALITTGALAYSTPPLPAGVSEVPLAADYSWSFTTPPPPPATISAVTPANGSTGLAITGTTVTATFGAAMTPSTINPSTFTLSGPGGVVPGTVIYNATDFTATFAPSVSLAGGAQYTATIGTGATSSLGGPLAAPYSWNFTTAPSAVPTVTSAAPASGATGVSVDNALTASFSEPMNAATLTNFTFTLTAGGSAVAGTVTYSSGDQTATFTPSAALAANTAFTATITTGAQSAGGAALASNYTWTFTTGASASSVAVSFGTTYQTIRGFGASEVFQPVLANSQITELYGQSSGQLGLSIMRIQIAPTTWDSTTQTADTSAWTTELTNAKAAQALGAIVFATPWTPPASMKTSSASQPYNSSCSSGTDLCGGYLNPASYADYANYLEAFVNYATNTMGVNLDAVSLQNEPDFNATYVSCLWTGAQFDTWIANYGSVLTTGANPVKLMMPESDQFNTSESDPALNDPAAAGYISIIGGHLYATPTPIFYYTNAENRGKDVWMTEHLLAPANGTAPTIADALTMAEEIHNSMTVGYYNAYVWWQGPSSVNLSPQEHLIDAGANPTYYGFAMAQFSRFIRPGYVRVSATANPASGIYVSAYTGTVSSTQHYAIVAINASTTTQNINFTLNDAATQISSMTPYMTTSAGGLVPQPAMSVTGGQFSYTMPAQSIVTFVQ